MDARAVAAIIAAACIGWSAVATAQIGTNQVGMNLHDGQQAAIDAARDLGVGWVRLDGNWFQIEPSSGQFDWTAVDRAVNAASAAGLNVYISLGYTPAWVARTGDTDGQPGNDVPDQAAWTDFVTAAVGHLRPLGVTHFGMWNEPDLQQFFEGDATQYANVIAKPGAAAVHAACMDCLALGPELANVGPADVWLETILQTVGASTFDIITHHSYNGFPELGTSRVQGDRFFNVLDRQRFPSSRRSLRQILDEVGYDGEVWITETGYRANVGDATDEANQAEYYRLVLHQQLARPWYTNTIFYEMADCGPDQPSCGIDGFGIIRATNGQHGSRTFPGDFRQKPAFDALKNEIAATPALRGGPPPQCVNGTDDDGDGRIDVDDRGCVDGADDDESDDVGRKPLVTPYDDQIVVDGDLGEWSDVGWVSLDAPDWRGPKALDIVDLKVRAAARWSRRGVYFAFDVLDEAQVNSQTAENLWKSDSVQLAFDIAKDSDGGYDGVDDHEIGVALTDAGVVGHRFAGPPGAADDWEVGVVRSGGHTDYEVFLPADVLPTLQLKGGSAPGFSFVVNDDDGSGRDGWMEWTRGIAESKDPYFFGELLLGAAGVGSAGDAGTGGDSGRTAAGAPDSGLMPGSDPSPRDAAPEPGGSSSSSGCQCTSAHESRRFDPTILLVTLGLFAAPSRRRRRTT